MLLILTLLAHSWWRLTVSLRKRAELTAEGS
jgi:hypothetical protein